MKVGDLVRWKKGNVQTADYCNYKNNVGIVKEEVPAQGYSSDTFSFIGWGALTKAAPKKDVVIVLGIVWKK